MTKIDAFGNEPQRYACDNVTCHNTTEDLTDWYFVAVGKGDPHIMGDVAERDYHFCSLECLSAWSSGSEHDLAIEVFGE